MFIRRAVVIFMLLTIFTTGRSINADPTNQDALNNLLSRLGSHNSNSSDNLVFMPPTFSVDIVSLLRWAVENSQAQNHVSRSQSKEKATSENQYYNSKRLLSLNTFNGKSYFFSKNQKLTWMESLSFCRSFGMDLVSIETEEEDNFIMQQITNIGYNDHIFWTSGNKVGRSTFLWMNGEQVIYENWYGNEPNLPITEHCIVLSKKKWFDWPCGQNQQHHFDAFFICEERIL